MARLPRSKWKAAGVSEVRGPDGGMLATHALGDAYAEAIIAGRVPYEAAVRQATAARRQAWELSPLRAIRWARVLDLLRDAGVVR